jgi:hypothetical protein
VNLDQTTTGLGTSTTIPTKATRAGGCLNNPSVRLDPAASVSTDPSCQALNQQLANLQVQLKGCQITDQAAVANIGQLVVGVGMIMGKGAATAAGTMIQLGSNLVTLIAPGEAGRADKRNKTINKLEAKDALHRAIACNALILYENQYCQGSRPNGDTFNPVTSQDASDAGDAITKLISPQIRALIGNLHDPFYMSRPYDNTPQYTSLITDCYNGYLFLNWHSKEASKKEGKEEAPGIYKSPTPFFNQSCVPLIECVSDINGINDKKWDVPTMQDLFPKTLTADNSCTNLAKARALASISDDMIAQLICYNFDGQNSKTCNTGVKCAVSSKKVKKDNDKSFVANKQPCSHYKVKTSNTSSESSRPSSSAVSGSSSGSN